jgi:phage gp36-like protein
MFLNIADYESTIKLNILEDITEGNDTNRIYAELTAQAVMEDYMRGRYDVALVFGAIGTARHKTVMRYMIDIALYELHTRISFRQIPDIRIERYNLAMQWLKDVREGKISLDLPILPEDNPQNIGITVTSVGKRQIFDF